ncbi:MAG: hypothetical protein K2X91_15565, partial [Thermoleophilia bacterium]|nr:hypothetical protein [Thermoleophilia bacterium]
MNRAPEQAALAGGQASSARAAPQRAGLRLEFRLGLLGTLVVAGVMAAVSGTQLMSELRTEMRERQLQLAESLTPLEMELQAARTPEEARLAVSKFNSAYAGGGPAHHHLSVTDAAARIVIDAPHEAGRDRQPLLTAAVPLVVPALGPDPVVLNVSEDGSAFVAARNRRWWAWAVHVGLTAGLILALLFVVIRREVTGPIERLLRGVRKMELGYWDDMPDPGGAREIRWLAWRFRALGQELSRTVEHLVAAQRRAHPAAGQPQAEPEATTPGPPAPTAASLSPRDDGEAVRRLEACLERLRRADPAHGAARSLAQIAWTEGATEAERIGRPELRMNLEDAALHVLDPDGFRDISKRIEAQRPGLEALARARATLELSNSLVTRRPPSVSRR